MKCARRDLPFQGAITPRWRFQASHQAPLSTGTAPNSAALRQMSHFHPERLAGKLAMHREPQRASFAKS
jgi:hypothetical protein